MNSEGTYLGTLSKLYGIQICDLEFALTTVPLPRPASNFVFNGSFPASFFFIFVFSIQLTAKIVQYKILPTTGFEPRTSGVESEETALPTEPQPLPNFVNGCCQSSRTWGSIWFARKRIIRGRQQASHFSWTLGQFFSPKDLKLRGAAIA